MATLVGEGLCAMENSLTLLLYLTGFACSCHGSLAFGVPLGFIPEQKVHLESQGCTLPLQLCVLRGLKPCWLWS